MLLLQRHVLELWPEVDATDGDGNRVRVAGATAVRVRGHVQPVSTAESARDGQTLTTLYRFTGRTFPAGAFARVTWSGRSWDIVGEPQRHAGASPASRNVTVLLRARGPEPTLSED